MQSREQYGMNVLSAVRKESLWHLYLEKFRDPIILILLVVLVLILGISVYEYTSGGGLQVF